MAAIKFSEVPRRLVWVELQLTELARRLNDLHATHRVLIDLYGVPAHTLRALDDMRQADIDIVSAVRLAVNDVRFALEGGRA